MQADPRCHIDARRSVSSSEKLNAGRVQLSHDVELVIDETTPNLDWIGIHARGDRLLHAGILLVDPRLWCERDVRILRVVDDIDKPLAAFPEERRTLPDVVL